MAPATKNAFANKNAFATKNEFATKKLAVAAEKLAFATKKLARKEVVLFLALTLCLSTVFYYLIPKAQTNSDALLLTALLMWCPAVAAILTRLHYQKNLDGFGFGWNETRWQLAGAFIPVLLGLAMFGSVWLAFGAFNVQTAEQMFSTAFLFAFASSLALNLLFALGEELGWRGLLVPELSKFTGFTKLALLSGTIWMSWHLPLILFGSYHGSGPLWFSLAMFAPSVIGSGVVIAWLRLKSGSVWPAVFFHGVWNYFIQRFYPSLTFSSPETDAILGEFGWASPVLFVVLAFVCWHYRGKLPKVTLKTVKPSQPQA